MVDSADAYYLSYLRTAGILHLAIHADKENVRQVENEIGRASACFRIFLVIALHWDWYQRCGMLVCYAPVGNGQPCE